MIASITVLVPVRGQATFLADAIASLRAQTCTDWQALLLTCDDATLHAANTHIDGDVRMQVMQAGGDEIPSLAHAANTLQTEFLCVLDGDDLLEPDALTALRDALLAAPDAGMAYGRHTLIDAAGKPLGPGPLCELPYSADALLLDFMTGPLRLLRASAYRAAGGYRAAHPDAADYDLCLRLSETCTIAHLPRVTYRRRVHASAPEVARWAEGIDARYAAFVDAVRRRGLDARYDCALEIDSWHILQPRAGGG